MHRLGTIFFDAYARVAARRALYPLHRGLYYLGARGMGLFNSKSFALSGERAFHERIVRRAEFEVVFDVGANVGDFARSVVRANPGCTVYAFEPHPRTYSTLVASPHPRIHTYNRALGAESGTLTLFDVAEADGTQLASLYRDVIARHTADIASHRVEVQTVDDVMESLSNVDRVDLLKIDTEGHERAVLEGARRTLGQKRIRSVLFEFNEMNVASRTFMHDFLDLLQGFRFYRLLPDGLIALEPYSPFFWETFAFQNVWAVSPDLAKELQLSTWR